MEIQAGQTSLPYGRLEKKGQFAGSLTAAGIGSPQGTHAAAAARRADADINVPDGFQQFRHGEPRVSLAESLAPLESKDKLQVFGLHPVVQEPVITDLLEPFREHVHQETADEFRVLQRDLPPGTPRFPAPRGEGGMRFRDRQDPVVRDSDFMGVAAEIFNSVSETVKGFFYVRAPVLIVKGIPESRPLVRVPQLFTGSGKVQLPVPEEGLKPREELSFKLIPESLHPDKKILLNCPELMIRGKAAAGNDAVHMYVVLELLIPCVEDLYDTWHSPKMLFVSGKFQERFRAAPVEEAIEKLLVTVKEWVELMWKCKYHMEIRGIDHLGPAFIDPELFPDSLAAGAAAVTAGAVVDFDMPALCTLADAVAKPAGLAV